MSYLQHIKNATAGRDSHELFLPNKYRIDILTPEIIRSSNDRLIMEEINAVNGLENAKVPAVQQVFFGGAAANYAQGGLEDTSYAFSIVVPLTLKGENMDNFYSYLFFKNWSDLIHNDNTGEQTLKREYTGVMTITNYNRKGVPFWVRKFKNVFISESLPAIDMDKTNFEGISEFEVSFVADYMDSEAMK